MSLARLTNTDLRKIAEAAMRLVKDEIIPDAATIADIADGDDDIPEIITNLAFLYFISWTTVEGAIHFLEIEREIFQDDEDLDEEDRKALLV